MIAEERVGSGLRGLLEYVVFEKQDNTDAANESFFRLEKPIERDTHGRRIALTRITDHKPGAAGAATGQAPQSLAGMRQLSGRGLVRLGAGPALLLPGHAPGVVEQRSAAPIAGLRRPGDRHPGAGGQKQWSNVAKKSRIKREIRGEFIAGTLTGSPQEMARQAAPFRAARPDIKAPVVHYSLSLQAGDGRKTPEEWKPMVESFLSKMGVPLDAAWVAYLHNDTTKQHCHVAFLRSHGNGEVWNREFSAKRAIQATAEIEKEFGLLTHDRTTKREKKRQTVEEKKFEAQLKKEGKTMSKEHIARQIDDFIESRKGQSYSLDELRSGLENAGIQVEIVERGGQMTGVKYQHEGIWISGSSIGDGYKAQGLLQRGLAHADAAAQSAPSAAQKQPSQDDMKAQQDDTPPVLREHNQRAAGVGDLLSKALTLPIEAMVKLIQMIIQMINRLLGRKEEVAGAPAGVLGRFSERTGRFEPGAFPAKNDPNHGKALAAVGAAAADVSALAGHVASGKRWSELLEHGAAPYKRQEGAADSYFARLRLPSGKEAEVWGKDIERALADAGVNVGDKVNLERAGREDVTIKQLQEDGTVKHIDTHRNAWKAEMAASDEPADLGQGALLSQAKNEIASLRDSTIRFLRDKAEFVGMFLGKGGAEYQSVMADLTRVGFGPADEVKYQAWRESSEAQPMAGESEADYIRRREIEYLTDQLAFHDKFKVGLDKDEVQQKTSRLQELRDKQEEHELETERERGRA